MRVADSLVLVERVSRPNVETLATGCGPALAAADGLWSLRVAVDGAIDGGMKTHNQMCPTGRRHGGLSSHVRDRI